MNAYDDDVAGGACSCGVSVASVATCRLHGQHAPPPVEGDALRAPGGGYWMTNDGRMLSIRGLDDGHLLNIERMLRRDDKRDDNITAEIERRRLTPLPPLGKRYAACTSAVSRLRAEFRHLGAGDKQHLVRGTIAQFLKEIGCNEAADVCETWEAK